MKRIDFQFNQILNFEQYIEGLSRSEKSKREKCKVLFKFLKQQPN